MAEVDFSNARIEPATIYKSETMVNATINSNLSLDNGFLRNVSGSSISTDVQRSVLVNEKKQLMYLFQGSFSASGTEFYVYKSDGGKAAWKISNISFSAGDTYVFQINATLVCN